MRSAGGGWPARICRSRQNRCSWRPRWREAGRAIIQSRVGALLCCGIGKETSRSKVFPANSCSRSVFRPKVVSVSIMRPLPRSLPLPRPLPWTRPRRARGITGCAVGSACKRDGSSYEDRRKLGCRIQQSFKHKSNDLISI